MANEKKIIKNANEQINKQLYDIAVNMVERVEVVKGAGSALYGSNAIAGTINIITKEPLHPSYSIGTDIQAIGLKSYAQNFNANAAVIGKNNKSGASFYQTFRTKKPYDHDNDGFSEIGKLDAFSFGTRAFVPRSSLKNSKIRSAVPLASTCSRDATRYPVDL